MGGIADERDIKFGWFFSEEFLECRQQVFFMFWQEVGAEVIQVAAGFVVAFGFAFAKFAEADQAARWVKIGFGCQTVDGHDFSFILGL